MAIFGVQTRRGRRLPAALGAARAIDMALDRLNDEIIDEIGQPLRIGMGIDVGPLVVRRHAGVRVVPVNEGASRQRAAAPVALDGIYHVR
jgi:adenylate cyclase